jgi:hypothetical protein
MAATRICTCDVVLVVAVGLAAVHSSCRSRPLYGSGDCANYAQSPQKSKLQPPVSKSRGPKRSLGGCHIVSDKNILSLMPALMPEAAKRQ